MQAGFLKAAYGPAGARFHLSYEKSGESQGLAGSWVIVTAWNPDARPVSGAANAAAQQRLIERVGERYAAAEAVVNGAGRWQEDALLVRGASLGDARRWAEEFGQAAAVFGIGRRAALVWRSGRVQRFWTVPA